MTSHIERFIKAEQERAADQARRTITESAAVEYLANEYQVSVSPMDESPKPRTYTHIGGDMRHYRVTVERVEGAELEEPTQHVECIKCGASVEVPSPESEVGDEG